MSRTRLETVIAGFSLGLGAVEVAAPSWHNRVIGLDRTAVGEARLNGVVELSAGAGLLALDPAPVLWSRVGADVVHTGLLARSLYERRAPLSSGREGVPRTAAALAGVLGIGALDLVAALSRSRR